MMGLLSGSRCPGYLAVFVGPTQRKLVIPFAEGRKRPAGNWLSHFAAERLAVALDCLTFGELVLRTSKVTVSAGLGVGNEQSRRNMI